jgi:hypothetical protein
VTYAPGAELAEEALSVGRSAAVRRALGEIEGRVLGGDLSLDDALVAIVAVVSDFGLRPVPPAALPRRIEASELGVVCWMGVLSLV